MSILEERAGQATKLEQITGRYDPVLLGLALLMAGFGVVMVGSSSIAIAEGHNVGPFHYLIRHVLFLTLGGALALALMRTELKLIERHNHLLLFGCIALLGLVFFPGIGHTVNGAQRWINLGVSKFQAVEAVKLLLIIWLASYVVRYRDDIGEKWSTLLKPLGVAGFLVALLLLQPDFGSAALILAITGGMVWLGGARIGHLLLIGAGVLPLLVGVGDVIGIYGGFLVGTERLGFNATTYLKNTADFLEMRDIVSSLAKGEVFGFIAALMGCYYGMNSARGAMGVGRATKGSVVAAAILILAANFILTEAFFSA